MNLKILSSNLKGISEKDKGFKELVALITKLKPDIILFQEIRTKSNKSKILSLLQKKFSFLQSEYIIYFDFSKDYGKGILQLIQEFEGLGILSKYKFDSEKINLPIIKGLDRWPRILIKYKFNNFSICNLHLSKYDKSRELEIKKIPKADIYAGDFNMEPYEINKFFPKDKISYNLSKYISYPSKNLTLDYFVLKKWEFVRFKCIPTKFSDHSALFAEINI